MVEHSSILGVDPFRTIEDNEQYDFGRGRITPSSFQVSDIAMEIDDDLSSDASSTNSSYYAIGTPFVTEDEECAEEEKAYALFHEKGDKMSSCIPNTTDEDMGFRRYPCKARNVGETHTSSTAYIELPPDATHGLQLYCSHPECSGSGRAFRWCNVCEVVVAKRNFVKRHSHGLLSPCRTKKRNNNKKKNPASKPLTTKSGQTDETIDELTLQGPHYECSKQEALQHEIIPPMTHSSQQYCSNILGQPPKISPLPTRNTSAPRSKIFPDDEDASIEAIGNLKGWNEADIDSIFD